jgi:nucleoside-diphosphate-sugar epimerase
MEKILVTGGAGYVGAVLIPKLIQNNFKVNVLDLLIYGADVFDNSMVEEKRLNIFKGDIRDLSLVDRALEGVGAVIHLACISNDPSFELNPKLGKSINLDAFRPLVELSKKRGIKRFINASSSSVYGIKETENVHEEMDLLPLTDYSKYKAMCEKILLEYQSDNFTTVSIRPATVCGYSPRQRLDVIVNILVNHAYHKREINVFGGEQKRPNIHIEDMADLYVKLLTLPKEKIAGKVFNAGMENHKVEELAEMVRRILGDDIKIQTSHSDDNRSYHISSKKIKEEIGFFPQKGIEDAILDLKVAFDQGRIPKSFEDDRYYNIKTMQKVQLE